MVYSDLLEDPEAREYIFLDEFGVREEEISKRAVVSPVPFQYIFPEDYEERLRRMGISFGYLHPTDPILSRFHGNLVLDRDGKKGIILFLGRGVVEFAERIRILATSPRIEEFLFLGSAGGVQGVRSGDLHIPGAVIPFESVSEVYVDATRHLPLPDEELKKEVLGYAEETGLRVVQGIHTTLPLIYMETREMFEYFAKLGVLSVDMELSAFLRIVRAYRKKGVGVLRISDLPAEGEHFYSEEYERKKKGVRKKALEGLFHIALRFLGMI